MFTRRILPSSRSILFRPFTTTSSLPRAPSLAQITPDGVASFEAKQKAFREKLAALALERQKQISSSESSASFHSTEPHRRS